MKHADAIIKEIQLTEKGTAQTELENKYFFSVATSANKPEIKQAVEGLFNVSVKSVNTMRYQGKRKRERTVRFGKRADWKRAIVTLEEGSRIDLA
jgi:large subunit ribosomal protein L23